ncbi:unnamed protein product [Ectocarpus sp. CCAP 1310/34]|nr:unnamed protein product [Ectocarpus sp. CCAP 1310/34]
MALALSPTSETHGVLAPDGLQLFRAPSPSARLDWVSAFAVVTTAHELGLCKTPPLPPPPPTPPSPTTAAATAGDAREESSGAPRPSRFGRTWGYRGGRKSDPEGEDEEEEEEEEEEEDQGGAWGETAAIGGRVAAAGVRARVTTASPPRRVMQGFLRKRAAARSWGSSGVWEYRWVVLRDDGRLLWYLSVPADPWEVPNGYLCLRGARVSFSEGVLLRNNLREDEVQGDRLCPFVVDVIEHGDGDGDGDSGGDPAVLQQAHWQQQQQQEQQEQQEQLRRRRGRGQQQQQQQQQEEARQSDRPRARSSEQPQQQREGERRVVFLSTWGTEERAEWVEALSMYTQSSGSGGAGGGKNDPRADRGRELRLRAEERRRKGLGRLLETPEEVLSNPHEAFALLVGSGSGGGVTRGEFCEGVHRPRCGVHSGGA